MTIYTSKAVEQPVVKAWTEGVSVELKKESKAFSLDFQVR